MQIYYAQDKGTAAVLRHRKAINVGLGQFLKKIGDEKQDF